MNQGPLTAIDQRLSVLKEKLRSRKGKKEYAENCEHIMREIARLEDRRARVASAKPE